MGVSFAVIVSALVVVFGSLAVRALLDSCL